MNEQTDKYCENHKKSGIRVGDVVTIMRKSESYEKGWQNHWIENMSNLIGKKCVVTTDGFSSGFQLVDLKKEYGGYFFPYFVLSNRQKKLERILKCT
jgi:hypothetical protein